jgi:hypothetical protein
VSKRQAKKRRSAEKRVDETLHLAGRRRGAVLKEEVWYEGQRVVKYSLAYVNPRLCGVDNGRVLGYDNGHDYHHRHFMGKVEEIEFEGYEALLNRFQQEVQELWRIEDEEKS